MAVAYPSVVRGAARNGQVEIGAFEFLRRGAGILRQPRIHDFDKRGLSKPGL